MKLFVFVSSEHVKAARLISVPVIRELFFFFFFFFI